MMTLYYKAYRVKLMTKEGGGFKIPGKSSDVINERPQLVKSDSGDLTKEVFLM